MTTTTTLPAMMQAVVLEEEGGPLLLRQRPVPQPGKNEVVIRMAASPINPSDLGYLRGMGETKRSLPTVPGIEGSGVEGHLPARRRQTHHLR